MRPLFRTLLRSPGLTSCAVLTLAVGIGATTASFTVVDAVLLRQLPLAHSERLVWIWSTRVDRDKAFFSVPNFVDTRDQNRSMDRLAALALWGANLTSRSTPERLVGVKITADAFGWLGAKAKEGRLLVGEDAASPRVVVLSFAAWQRLFAGDRRAIGQTLTLNGDPYTLVGVLPCEFALPAIEADVFVPLDLASEPRCAERGSNFLRAFGRLAPGVARGEAQADLGRIAQQLARQFPDENAKLTTPRLVPLQEELVGGHRATLLILLGAVGLVLLLVCANLASLLITRTTGRRRELCIRVALGATRGRLLRQLLAESLLLATAGGALGLVLAMWGVDAARVLAASLPRSAEIHIDARMLAFAAALSIAAGLLFGTLPALFAARAGADGLQAGGRTTTDDRRAARTRGLLVTGEVALSMMLVVCAGLLVTSLIRLQAVDPGFDPRRLLLARVSLPPSRYAGPDAVFAFYDRISRRLAELPGVEAVGATSVLPLSGVNARTDFLIAGKPAASRAEIPAAQYRWVSAGYFHTMRMEILEGRDFAATDLARAQPVVAIDDALARRHWPGASALGSHLLVDEGVGPPRDAEVVAVVRGVKHTALDDAPTPTLYAPLPQLSRNTSTFVANNLNLVLRTRGEPAALADAVRRTVQSLDPDVPASTDRTMDRLLEATVAPRRFTRLMLEIFAAAALLLMAIGLYGVLSYSIARRTREIAIRRALGATNLGLFALVMRQGLGWVLGGILLGAAGALLATRLLSSFLFGVGATDPMTYGVAAAIATLVGALAAYLPVRRAARIDPVLALSVDS